MFTFIVAVLAVRLCPGLETKEIWVGPASDGTPDPAASWTCATRFNGSR